MIIIIERKLYEQDKFPGAPIIPVFEKYFGKFEDRDFSEVEKSFIDD